jgi:hypothetical protein
MKLSLSNPKGGTVSPGARSAFTWGTSNGFVPNAQRPPAKQLRVVVVRPADAAMSEDAEDAVACLVKLGLQRQLAVDGVRRAVASGITDIAEMITFACRKP